MRFQFGLISIMSRIGNFIRKLDILAPDLAINVQGKRTVTTKIGALISIVFCGLIFYLSSIHISEFTDTTQPQINVRDDIMEVYPEINLGKSKHLPMMFVKSHTTGMIKFSDLTSYITLNANFLTVIHQSNGSLYFANKPVKIISCGELVKAGTFDTDFYKNLGTHTNKVEEYGICFDPEDTDLTISGGYATLNATFRFYPFMSTHVRLKTNQNVQT